MFCPRCGQEQISNETRFCSRCGFLLTGVVELIANNGNVALSAPNSVKGDSQRRRGLKQGFFFFLLTFLVVPIITILSVWINAKPFAVVIASIIFFIGGLLRMAYAMLFESNDATDKTIEQTVYQTTQNLLNRNQNPQALSGQQSIPVENYAPPKYGNWRDTEDLEPSNVIDSTTKLLQNDR